MCSMAGNLNLKEQVLGFFIGSPREGGESGGQY